MFGLRTVASLILVLLLIDDITAIVDQSMPLPMRIEKFNSALKRVNELHQCRPQNISTQIQELEDAMRDNEYKIQMMHASMLAYLESFGDSVSFMSCGDWQKIRKVYDYPGPVEIRYYGDELCNVFFKDSKLVKARARAWKYGAPQIPKGDIILTTT